ncbi:MAG: ankyrin repeat domain-containing protein [Alphaproteobacteria bacterium]|nr:ankyrin repeat domain-containing protein [Alphaproteobacteria bacterium]
MVERAELFERAGADDAPAVLAALPADRPLHALRTADGESLLLFCVYRRRRAVLAALLSRDPPLTLHEAAALGARAKVEAALAAAPWAIDTLSPDGWTALHLAAHFGHRGVVDALLAAGADANLRGRGFERNLPLHAAAAGGRLDCALRLVPVTADVDARQGGGWTALMLAAQNGLAPLVEALLERGADAALVNDAGIDALALARYGEWADIVDQFVE